VIAGFALGELKALLAGLIGAFEFTQAEKKHVEPKTVYGVTGKILGLKVEARVVEGW